MRILPALTAAICAGLALTVQAGMTAAAQPLTLMHRYDLPDSIKGHFDHFAVDAAGKRLFGTAVEDKVVIVFDFGTGTLIKEIHGVEEPRAVLYRSDLGRLYVSDGAGALRIFDSNTFASLKTLPLAVDADPIAYDPATKRLFVVNGGEKAKHTYSNITVFDTTAASQIGQIQLDGLEIEGLTVETGGPRLFANNRGKNQLDIFNRNDFSKIAVWPVTSAKLNTVSALDESAHRLFVAGHQGQLVIFDSHSGKELQSLPIGAGADDIAFDAATRRIYIAGGGGHGSIDVYQEIDADHYHCLGRITTEPGAATARLIPELGEYVVMAPPKKGHPAQVLVFEVSGR
jgi:DNA-binding beta-propeller fold protein YncE